MGLSPGLAHAGKPADVVDVVIVGAGLAGLTAVRDLRHAGCEAFVVLEARSPNSLPLLNGHQGQS